MKPQIKVSNLLQKNATEEEREQHIDIADWLITDNFISIIWRKRTDVDGPKSGPQYPIDNKDIGNDDSQSGPQYGPQGNI